MLGLLRLEKCAAAALLRENGIEYTSYRVLVSASPQSRPKIETPFPRRHIRATERPNLWDEESKTVALSLQVTLLLLEGLLDGAVRNIDAYSDDYGEALLKRRPWSRKQALGHLTDWAITHQQWVARALTGPKLLANGYPMEDWVSAQQYESCSWPNIVDLWLSSNRLLVHVLSRIPEEKIGTPCRIGIDEPIPLSELIARYVEHCEDVLGQILARL